MENGVDDDGGGGGALEWGEAGAGRGVGEVGAGGEEWKEGGGGERADGRGRRKVVISQLLINILRLRAFQRNVINWARAWQ